MSRNFYKLKYLELPTLVDAALLCARNHEPVAIHIATEPGCGKTYSTKSLEHESDVLYFRKSFTPTEFKKHIKKREKEIRLIIHDDMGRNNPKLVPDFIYTSCDLIEQESSYRCYKNNININLRSCSVVNTSTLAWYYSYEDILTGSGYLDRVIPIRLSLDPMTEETYRYSMQVDAENNHASNNPKPRKPFSRVPHNPMDLTDYQFSSRRISNLLSLSKFLNEDEMGELIRIVSSDDEKFMI